MPSFIKGGGSTDPFGPNEYLRSTRELLTESATFAAATLPTVEMSDGTTRKILWAGCVIAKITSGDDAGKVGVFQAGATDGRGEVANIVGLNDTFLPYQLLDADQEVSVVYACSAVQDWCRELDAAGLFIPLTDTTAAGLRGGKNLDIKLS